MFGATKLGGRKTFRLAPWLCAAGGVMCGAAMPARADHTCGPQCRRVWVAPVYEKRSRVVVTPAKYEDVVRRVWREPVYEERRVLTKVPAEFRWVERPVYDSWGRMIGYERVEELVRPAYDRWEVHKILVCPGRWEEIRERVLVCPEKRDVIWEDVLVCEGYWKMMCNDRPIPLIEDLKNSTRPHARPVSPITVRPIGGGYGGHGFGTDRDGFERAGFDFRFEDRLGGVERDRGFEFRGGSAKRVEIPAKAPVSKRPAAAGR